MGTKINSLIMHNRLLSQAKSRSRSSNTAIGKALMKNSGSSNKDSLVNGLQQKSESGSLSGDLKKRDNYTTMKNSAKNLLQQTKDFLAYSDEEWEKLSEEQKAEYKEKLAEDLPGVIGDYNKLLGTLSSGDTASKVFYKQLMGYFDKAKSELAKLGITQNKDGTLSLNKKLFEEADPDTIQRALGKSGSFISNINKRMENIISNADTNLSVINNSLFAGNYSYNRYGSDIYNILDGLGGYDAKS